MYLLMKSLFVSKTFAVLRLQSGPCPVRIRMELWESDAASAPDDGARWPDDGRTVGR